VTLSAAPEAPAEFAVVVAHDEAITLVHVTGVVDAVGVYRLRRMRDDANESGRDVLVDLCDCRSIDGGTIRALDRAQRCAFDAGRWFVIARAPGGAVSRAFDREPGQGFALYPDRRMAWSALCVVAGMAGEGERRAG
jgi:hypothetical protein